MARNQKQYSVQLHPEVAKKIKEKAEHRGVNFSDMIRNLIVIGLASPGYQDQKGEK